MKWAALWVAKSLWLVPAPSALPDGLSRGKGRGAGVWRGGSYYSDSRVHSSRQALLLRRAKYGNTTTHRCALHACGTDHGVVKIAVV